MFLEILVFEVVVIFCGISCIIVECILIELKKRGYNNGINWVLGFVFLYYFCWCIVYGMNVDVCVLVVFILEEENDKFFENFGVRFGLGKDVVLCCLILFLFFCF